MTSTRISLYYIIMTYTNVCGEKTVKRQQVTLKDIARHCDLAPTTVSRILNGKSTYCSQEKISLVRKTALEWDYRPNIGYRIMTGRDTNIASIIFSQPRITQDDQINRLYMQLCAGLDERNFALYTAVLNGEREAQMRKIHDLDERGCRFYIFIGTPTCCEEICGILAESGRVCIGFNNITIPRGVMTNQAGAYLQYMDLAAQEGRKNFRIAVSPRYFEQQLRPYVLRERETVLPDTCLCASTIGFVTGNSAAHCFRLGYSLMRKELSENPGIEAMAFPTDYHVFGASAALHDAQRNAETVHLFGMGDAVASRFMNLRFTTARFDMEKCGEMLLEHLRRPGEWKETLSPEIIQYHPNESLIPEKNQEEEP